MQEYVLCSDGKRRKATRINCKFCSKEHLVRNRGRVQTYEFCSAKCFIEYKKSTSIDVSCAQCNKPIHRALSKATRNKSGLNFCSKSCKDEAQKLGGIKAIQPPHYGTGKIDYRALFTDNEMFCNRCNYKEFACSVHIHHIDGDRTNNNKKNLIPLCGNCHLALHHGYWALVN